LVKLQPVLGGYHFFFNDGCPSFFSLFFSKNLDNFFNFQNFHTFQDSFFFSLLHNLFLLFSYWSSYNQWWAGITCFSMTAAPVFFQTIFFKEPG
jgi:hypothetical protein